MGNGQLRHHLWWCHKAYQVLSYLADKDCMLQVTVALTFDLRTPKSIGIIYGYLPDKDFMLQVIVALTFDLRTPKSIGIIYGNGQVRHQLW